MYSGYFSTVVSHIISLLSTLWAFLYIGQSDIGRREVLAIRFAFGLVTINSSLAIVRYGNLDIGYKLRKHHITTLNLSTIFSVTIIEAMLHHIWSSPSYCLLFVCLNTVPLVKNLSTNDYHIKTSYWDSIIGLNAIIFLIVAIMSENYNAVAFMLSYVFGYFVVGDCGYFLDTEVPSVDTYQYLQCFLNYFIVHTFSY